MKEIILTRGMVALVSDEDYEELSKYKWSYHKKGYATRNILTDNGKQKMIYMHRQIMGAPPNKQVDHINMNKLDNRRENLRLCNNSENQMNTVSKSNTTSKYKGVSWHKDRKKWQAYVDVGGGRKYLGLFDSEVSAALVRDKYAEELHGDFVRLNIKKGEH